MEKQVANNFLKRFPNFWWQTFDDRKDRGQLVKSEPAAGISFDELEELNDQGAGIYFSVNQFGERRKKEHCLGINAWMAEIDDMPKDEQFDKFMEGPLQPTGIVQTRNSMHCYWFTDKDYSEEAIDTYRRVQRGLIDYFDSDPKVKDIPRVMRVPGFNHMKQDPYLVTIAKPFDSDINYTPEEMLEAFPAPKEEQGDYEEASGRLKLDGDEWDFMSQLDDVEMLKKLSGDSLIDNQKISFKDRSSGGYKVCVNGKEADAFIDKYGKLGGGAAGSWIQWCLYPDYNNDRADVINWFKKNCRDMIPPKMEEKFYGKKLSKNKDDFSDRAEPNVTKASDHVQDIIDSYEDFNTDYTWGMEKLDHQMPLIQEGHFVLLFGQQASGKTTFSFWMARENSKRGHKVLFLSLEMGKQQLIRSYLRDRRCISKDQFRNGDYNPKAFAKHAPEIDSISLAGIDEGQRYGVEDIANLIEAEDPDLMFIDNLNKIDGGKGKKRENIISRDVSAGLLNLTNQYQVPLVVLHHANKRRRGEGSTNQKYKNSDEDKNMKDLIRFRGMPGLRGTNKIADDADSIIEIARPEPSDEDYTNNKREAHTTGLASYKDREFGTREREYIFYTRGEYHPEWDDAVEAKDELAQELLEEEREINSLIEF